MKDKEADVEDDVCQADAATVTPVKPNPLSNNSIFSPEMSSADEFCPTAEECRPLPELLSPIRTPKRASHSKTNRPLNEAVPGKPQAETADKENKVKSTSSPESTVEKVLQSVDDNAQAEQRAKKGRKGKRNRSSLLPDPAPTETE